MTALQLLALAAQQVHCPIERGVVLAGTKCTEAQKEKAKVIKEIHDPIERCAYKALADIVIQLNIHGDAISEEQSGQILAYVRDQAHVELFKPGGRSYGLDRFKIIEPSMALGIRNKLLQIVHDRDGKLTDARYFSLTDMVMGMDDHNNMVKEICLKSWHMCEAIEDPDQSHLNGIKSSVEFYERLAKTLKFDLKTSIKSRQELWDRCFPDLRTDPMQAKVVVNVMEVRNYFGVPGEFTGELGTTIEFPTPSGKLSIPTATLDAPLSQYLNDDNVKRLFKGRVVFNVVRKQEQELPPILSNKKMTVRQFLTQYFPDIAEKLLKGDKGGAPNAGEAAAPAVP